MPIDIPLGAIMSQGGPVALISLFVILILTGRLVPRAHLDDVRTDREIRLGEVRAEKEEWRAAYKESEAARVMQARQLEKLLEYAETTDAFLRSLPKAGIGAYSSNKDGGEK